ncbi:MAG TPA: transcriptional repressor LexA [bacterium]|nr:transcriptional repressor LexA [bacterium]HXK92909.1 transcriptional repressor LexA [bacterium]
MPELSPRQREILDYLEKYKEEQGYPPTLREICKKFAISSTNGARYHLQRLMKLGYLEIDPHKSRGVKQVKDASRTSIKRSYRMPVLGTVPAGPLNLAAPDIREDELHVDPGFFGSRGSEPDLFGLRVRGDSMIGVGIQDGDIVVVRPQPNPNNGDIVVARVEEDATVKRFRRLENEIVLEPANPAVEPIHVPDQGGVESGQNVAILGVVVGLIRSM